MSIAVETWWLLLCAVSMLNVLAWLASAATFKGAFRSEAEADKVRRQLLLLSAGYVFGCAFRSVFPVYDVQRLCVVDSWLSSVIVGRSVATVAELSFVAQCSLLLRHVAHGRAPRAEAVSRVLLPVIVAAELCSWHAVLTTNNFGHVIEEGLWAGTVAVVVLALLLLRGQCAGRLRTLVNGCAAVGGLYVAYMLFVDVPMYYARWIADEAAGRPYLGWREGLIDAAGRCRVSSQWNDWRSEVVWMTLYFSLAVWLSIALVHAPLRPAPSQQ